MHAPATDEIALSLTDSEAALARVALRSLAERSSATARLPDPAVSAGFRSRLGLLADECERLAARIDAERRRVHRQRMQRIKRRAIDRFRALHASAHGTTAVEPRSHRGHGANP